MKLEQKFFQDVFPRAVNIAGLSALHTSYILDNVCKRASEIWRITDSCIERMLSLKLPRSLSFTKFTGGSRFSEKSGFPVIAGRYLPMRRVSIARSLRIAHRVAELAHLQKRNRLMSRTLRFGLMTVVALVVTGCTIRQDGNRIHDTSLSSPQLPSSGPSYLDIYDAEVCDPPVLDSISPMDVADYQNINYAPITLEEWYRTGAGHV